MISTKEAALTSNLISSIIRPVGRRKINEEQMPARLPAGTLARMDAVLGEKEKRSDLVREAVERPQRPASAARSRA
jgi:hypothetical protein